VIVVLSIIRYATHGLLLVMFSPLSAGLGRSGTFMGIDMGIQQVKECVVLVNSLPINVASPVWTW